MHIICGNHVMCELSKLALLQAWNAAKQGDEENTKHAWKRYRIWRLVSAIWLVIGVVILGIIVGAAN